MCANIYQNRPSAWFDKVTAKIKWCNFLLKWYCLHSLTTSLPRLSLSTKLSPVNSDVRQSVWANWTDYGMHCRHSPMATQPCHSPNWKWWLRYTIIVRYNFSADSTKGISLHAMYFVVVVETSLSSLWLNAYCECPGTTPHYRCSDKQKYSSSLH